MVDNPPTPATPLDEAAEDFLRYRPYYTRSHVSTILLHIEVIGLPYCYDCHDWHQDDEDHSEVVVVDSERGSAGAAMLALASWVGAMVLVAWCLVGWFAPEPAAATRTLPGADRTDLCRAAGVQTVHDVIRGRIVLRDLDPTAPGRQGDRCRKGPRWSA